MTMNAIFWSVISFGVIITLLLLGPWIYKGALMLFKKSKYSAMGESSKIRLVRQLNDAVTELSNTKTGAIITIVHKNSLDNFRTDGIKIDANISSSLIISIFNKHSPLHDGAIVVEDNKITYAATYYKITSRSVDNKYGARHRAAMGISEQTDALTIVVSEQTGGVSFAKNSVLTPINLNEFQEKLTQYLK